MRSLLVCACSIAAPALGAPTADDVIAQARAARRLMHRAANDEVQAALDTFWQTRGKLPDDARAGAVRKATVKTLLAALHAEGRLDRRGIDNPREPVQWWAALRLGELEPAAFDAVARAVARGLLKESDYHPSHRVWEALCASLLRLDLARGAPFLMDEVVDARLDVPAWRRTRAALRALAAAPRPDAKARHDGVKRMLAIFQSFVFHVEKEEDVVAGFRSIRAIFQKKLGQAGSYWADMRPLVTRLLRRWTADPATGELARDIDSGEQLELLERIKVWNSRHKNRRRGPWIDPSGAPARRTALLPVREPGQHLYRKYAVPWPLLWPHHAPADAPPDEASAPRRAELREKILPDVFGALLADPAFEVRGMAAIGLARIGTKDALATLLVRLDADTHERAREAVAWALLTLRDPKLRDEWRRRADDATENPQVRALALLALGLLGDAAWPRARLEGPETKDPVEIELRGCAAAALGLAGEAQDARRLAEIMLARDSAPGVRGAAAAALAGLDAAERREPLVHALRRDGGRGADPIRLAAVARALAGAVGAKDRLARVKLAQIFERPKGRFGGHRVEAARTLARTGGRAARATLLRAAEECRKEPARAAEYGSMLFALAATGGQDLDGELARHLDEAACEWDAAAAALALAQAGAFARVHGIRARMDTAERIFIEAGLEALGRLRDRGALGIVRGQLRHGAGDRAVAAGAGALARLRGAEANEELLALWDRAIDRAEFAGLAEAFGIAGPGGAEAALETLARDAKRRPARSRAFALLALARMADPEDALHRRLRATFFPYDAPRTLTRLARFGDSFFLAETDE